MYCIFYTAVPKPPASLRVSNVGNDNVSLEWSPPSDDGGARIKEYHVEYCLEGTDKWTRCESVSHYTTHYTVKKLQEERSYYFGVLVENSAGISSRRETDRAVKIKKQLSEYR